MPPRILLVDDDEDITDGIRLRLSHAGYECTLAADGEAGLQAALADPPHAILLDVRMPKRDGMSVLRELKSRPATARIPIIMLSASLIEQHVALDVGARFFLSKPYDGVLLLRTLRYALDDVGQ